MKKMWIYFKLHAIDCDTYGKLQQFNFKTVILVRDRWKLKERKNIRTISFLVQKSTVATWTHPVVYILD